jgi:hypothetical protein
MYPSIPRTLAIAALRRLLQQDPTLRTRTTMSVDHIISLQEAVLHLAHFQWQGVYYAQTEGCAMGDTTSTPFANAYMTEFETDVLTTYRNRHDPLAIPPAAAAPTGAPPTDQPTIPPTAAAPTGVPPTNQPPAPSVILFCFCQADDTMTAIHCDHATHFLNSIHGNIKWTFEGKEDGKINMLDLTILRQPNGTLEFDVY